MWKWLLPKSTNFFDYFEKHFSLVVQASEELQSLVTSNPSIDLHSKTQKIKELEHQADHVAYHCIKDLHITFITPFQRTDIHKLISSMDDVIDFADETSQRIITNRIVDMPPEVAQLANILVQATRELDNVISHLRNMKHSESIQHSLKEVHRLESAGDAIYFKALGNLFDDNDDTLLIIKWKDIYEDLEAAIDACQDVANIIEGVILEST